MMKKDYEELDFEVIRFLDADVIRTSGEDDGDDEDEEEEEPIVN